MFECVCDSYRSRCYKLWLGFNAQQCKLGNEGGAQTGAQVPQALSTRDAHACLLQADEQLPNLDEARLLMVSSLSAVFYILGD